MTAREMLVEFERLVLLANPEFIIDNKIDSDTIFYFLNAYQERWIKLNYVNLDQTKGSVESLRKTLDAFKSLIVSTTLNNGKVLSNYQYAKRFTLPNDYTNKFYLYLRSDSDVSGTYVNVSGTSTITNIDANNALDIVSLTIPDGSTYASFSKVLPSYIVPSTYNSITEGPVKSSTGKIYFYYQGVLYYKWEANSKYKSYTSYVNVYSTTSDITDASTANVPLKGTIYKLYADSAYTYYDSDWNTVTVSSSTVDKLVKVPNTLITQDDVDNILVTYYNKPILRRPCALLDSDSGKNNYITIYTDSYTVVNDCTITYIRKPRKFNVLNPTLANDIVNECELSDNVHLEIVEGAVDMFIREGAYRLQVKQDLNNSNN